MPLYSHCLFDICLLKKKKMVDKEKNILKNPQKKKKLK